MHVVSWLADPVLWGAFLGGAGGTLIALWLTGKLS